MKKMETPASNYYSTTELKSLTTHLDEPTQQALAIEYTRMEWSIFPCDKKKAPIVDPSLSLTHGLKNATKDPKIAAKIWHKYPMAAIGFAIPPEIIVFDCDVRKDSQKRPLVSNGLLKRIGLESFQKLILERNITGNDLRTLSVRTQSGGTHFYFKMPDGTASFNRTGVLPGLDLKGFGGYTILPNSPGEYGKYHFLNVSEIREIPAPLLTWIMQFRGKTENHRSLLMPAGNGNIDREEVIRILQPYWDKADGRRNDFTLAIAGFIARSGGNEQDAVYIVSKLCDLTKKGYDHISGSKYAFRRNGSVKGLRSLLKLMEEIANDKQ